MKKYKNKQNNVNHDDFTMNVNGKELSRIEVQTLLVKDINKKLDEFREDFDALTQVNPKLASYLTHSFWATILQSLSEYLLDERDKKFNLDEIL